MDRKDLFLESSSGFMMPFILDDDHETVEIMLGYGEQRHPHTGNMFHHCGIDYVCPHLPLLAVATGTVVGVGNDSVHDDYIVVRYNNFDVKYGHIEKAVVSYGTKVVAGQQVAVSGDFLHLDVHFSQEEIDPSEFIAMLDGNICTLLSLGMKNYPQLVTPDVEVKTDFDKDMDAIQELLLQYYPAYVSDISKNVYHPSEKTEASLRNVMMQAAERNYFYEVLPSLVNPLGLTSRAGSLVGKVQNLLLGDFLSYLAACHNVHVPGMSDEQKKNLNTTSSTTAS